MHDLTMLTTLAGGLGVALVFGWITRKLGLSTLVGYMLAGIVVGPFTPGYVADVRLASQMAEIGVILLMFGVGMHFHPQELLRVWRLAVPGALAQTAVAATAGWALARAFGWSHAAGAVFGMALGVASTVVLMRMLIDQSRLGGRDGHVAVGWLIVEDLFTVAALVILPILAAGGDAAPSLGPALLLALAKVLVFALLVGVAGNKVVSRVLARIARTQSTELFTLTVFVLALGIALLASEVFQVSVALGAFFAGLVVGQSRFGPQAAADMAPFRDVFSALFFVSVGMLFNPGFVLSHPWMVLGVLAIVLVLKPLVAVAIVGLLREPRRTAATVAVGLAQIGEFSFILASLGTSTGVLPREAMDALVVAAIVSIGVNPLLFRWIGTHVRDPAKATPVPTGPAAGPASPPVAATVVLAGYGGLGRRLAARCAQEGIAVCAIHRDPDLTGESPAPGIALLFGDAARDEVLIAAGLGEARILIVADMLLSDKIQVCTRARRLNPRIVIIGAAASDADKAWLQEFGAQFVSDARDEQSEQMARAVRSFV
jgi:CPA2 family monovalent cation:H+ antiporter-2